MKIYRRTSGQMKFRFFLRNWETVVESLERYDSSKYEQDYVPLEEVGLDGNREDALTISAICQFLEIDTDGVRRNEGTVSYYNLGKITEHSDFNKFVKELEERM